MFKSILSTTGSLTGSELFICLGVAILLGFIISTTYMLTTDYSKNFVITLTILPAMVQAVIILVNGNLGTSVAILGAFGLVRFRSVPGTSKEISAVFLAMAAGLSAGVGLLAYAGVFTIVVCALMIILTKVSFGEKKNTEKALKIVIPENLDYTNIFDDLFETYTKKVSLDRVKTTNMGSLYELTYTISLKDSSKEKELIDAIRCRNGNLTVLSGRPMVNREEL
ncbi:MAG: DUF4956 domain-containing protein [bacterium]|nr:DUF4956 domain-containing protein [bacterium]